MAFLDLHEGILEEFSSYQSAQEDLVGHATLVRAERFFEKKRSYASEYYARNSSRYRKYRQDNRERRNRNSVLWRANNLERSKELKKNWREKNREKENATRRANYARKKLETK